METVEDYMTTNHPVCLRTDNIQKVSQKMIDSNTSEIIIVDSEKTKHPIGIVYEHDINNCCIAQGKDASVRTSEDCMKTVQVMIKSSMTPEHCLKIMEKNNLLSAPVVNESEEFCGFVNHNDLASIFLD